LKVLLAANEIVAASLLFCLLFSPLDAAKRGLFRFAPIFFQVIELPFKKKKSFASERQKNYLAIPYFANPHASLRHSPISGFFHFFKKTTAAYETISHSSLLYGLYWRENIGASRSSAHLPSRAAVWPGALFGSVRLLRHEQRIGRRNFSFLLFSANYV
jgi:hypothetical protein